MGGLWQDVRFALRTFARRPGFVALALSTLALGIGASTAIFSLVNGALLKGVPGLSPPPGLVEISRNRSGDYVDVSYPVFRHWRNSSSTLADVAAFKNVPLALDGDPELMVIMGHAVTGNYFALLDVRPSLGRFFESGAWFYPRVNSSAVISHRLWMTRFGGRPDVIGRTVRLNGHPTEIIGVAQPGFRGHRVPIMADIFVPVGMPAPGMESAAGLEEPDGWTLEAIGRLATGADEKSAAAELTFLAESFLTDAMPGADRAPYRARVDPWGPVPGVVRTGVGAFLAIMIAIVAFALTMTCTNAASMILARVTERRRELATRLALGASRARIARQLLTESLLLFMSGGIFGVLLAAWLSRLLLTFEPPLPAGFAIELDLSLDWRVLAFALATSAVACLVFGVWPALRAAPGGPAGLRPDAAGGHPARLRTRQTLIAVQMTVTVLLLVVAGLFIRALGSLRALDSGWDPAGVYIMPIDLELTGYSPERGRVFFAELLEQVRGLPSVEAASLARKLPLGGRSTLGEVNVLGVAPPQGRRGFTAFFNTVSPDYFRTVHLPLLQGRDFDSTAASAGPTVAVVSRAMARRFWPAGEAVGRRFYVGPPASGDAYEVVGVVEDAKYDSLAGEPPNFFYVPHAQRYNHQMTLHVRSAAGADLVVEDLRRIVRGLDPGLPVQAITTFEQGLELFLLPQRLASWVAGSIGLAGLLLASIGVYGLTAFAVAMRRQEVGIRLALGAGDSQVVRMLVRQGVRAPLSGAAAGIGIALLIGQLLGDFLAGVSPFDVVTFGGVGVGLLVLVIVAAFVPAWRASKLDPAVTLRAE